MERRPALSVLRVVSRLLWGLKSARLPQDPFAASSLRVQALVSGLLYSKHPALTATNGSRAAPSIRGL
jgi:hypothetical protein